MERLSKLQNNGDAEELSGLAAKMAQQVQFIKHKVGVDNIDHEAQDRWGDLCLVGVNSLECTRQRFLECYSSWFMKLLPVLKQQTDPVFVRSAALASITDLIVRLGGFIDVATVRRDGAQLTSKLIQPLLHLIGDKTSNVLLDEAMDLLIAALKYFPTCLRQQSINVEVSLVARLADDKCRSSVRQKCAKALAFLPKAHGDAASWSSLMRRVLIAVNADLDFAFRGMEDASVAEGATRDLLPVGQDPPRPLGGQTVPASSGVLPGKNLWQQLLPRIFSLLQCCNYLLTSPYPAPVPAPVGPLLTLIMRILRVDGSRSSRGSSLFSSQQASLRSELPALHLSALELLAATLRGVRGQLLPRGAALANLLTDHFRHTGGRYPSLRIKLYAISRDLFIAMGAGMASALAPAVVGSAFLDLKGSSSKEYLPFNVVKASGVSSGSSRKRKEAGGLPSINGLADLASTEEESRAPLAVQVAALQALEALLNTGGALLPERWRAEVDAVLTGVAIRVAADTTSFNLSCDDESSHSRTTSISVDVQVAAYQALLASLLAPCGHRPPYLAQGLALFRNGRKAVGTEVATVCARALMALEPLIHPRCLPPANAFTEMGMNKAGHPGSMTGGNANGGSSMKFGHLSMDPWAVVDTWLGYGEEAGDDVDDVDDVMVSHSERNNSLVNGAANGERVTSGNGGLAADRVTSDETHLTEPSGNELVEDPMQTEAEIVVPDNTTVGDSIAAPEPPSKQGHDVQIPSVEEPPLELQNSQPEATKGDLITIITDTVTSTSVTTVAHELVEDPMQTETEIVAPDNITVGDSIEVCHAAPEPPSKQGHEEPPLELENPQPAVTKGDLVTISTDIVTSTSVITLGPASTSQVIQESSLETMEIVEVKTVSTVEPNSTFPKVIELGSDSDSDGPLPNIVDGDPDSESD